MNRIIVFTILLNFVVTCVAQTIYLSPIEVNMDTVNRFDSLGKEDGLWIDNRGCMVFYTGGKVNGLLMSYGSHLDQFFSVSNGSTKYGMDVFFGNYLGGAIVVNHKPNTDFSNSYTANIFREPYLWQGYCYEYNEYGQLEAEGWMIWNEHWVTDSEQVGIWKHYDLDGNITYKDMEEFWRQRAAEGYYDQYTKPNRSDY